MSKIDTAGIRERWSSGIHCDVHALCDEIDHLRAALATQIDAKHRWKKQAIEQNKACIAVRAEALEEAAKLAFDTQYERDDTDSHQGHNYACELIAEGIRALASGNVKSKQNKP